MLHFTAAEVGLVGSAYLTGAIMGAVLFGYLTDRFGRKRLFMVTLGIYLTATAATALSWDFWSFAVFRFLTGAGIGGEYTAINSAIQELIPARFRGRTDLAINGSFWLGAALGAGGAIALLQPGILPLDWGWRAAFGIGAVLGLGILGLRQFIPESPRWLILHARPDEAEVVTKEIERRVSHTAEAQLPQLRGGRIRLAASSRTPMVRMVLAIVRDYPQRAILGLVLMSSQAFFYNAIFFSYALVLTKFYGHRAQANDRLDLRDLGRAAGDRRLFLPRRRARCRTADAVLDRDLLFCLGSGQRRISDRQRELSDRGAGARHRLLLRARYRAGRRRLAMALRHLGRLGGAQCGL